MENESIILPEHQSEVPKQPVVYPKRPWEGKETILFGAIVLVAFVAGALGSIAMPAVTRTLEGKFPTPRSVSLVSGGAASKDAVVAEDSVIVSLVEKTSPAVVSVVAKKDVSKLRNYGSPFGMMPFFFGNPFDGGQGGSSDASGGQATPEKQTVGSGTGFFVSSDGLIVTNKHVVSDEAAEYSVLLPGGKEYPAKVLARSPTQDIAVLKVEGSDFPTLAFGNSSALKVGQTVIAIGNSLGEFSNSVSRGIISGLGRSVTAGSGRGDTETLSDIIQTDAAINPGNSGGPLLDVFGNVIGINVAVAQGAQNVGFSLPVAQVERAVEDVRKTGKISSPYLGIRYVMIDESVQKENSLPYGYGVAVVRGTKQTDFAVIPGSPADKAGIVENDIVLEINGTKLDADHPLMNVIAQLRVGDVATLKVWHKGETKDMKVTLEERAQ